MTRPTLSPALSGLLGGWLPRQRWFPVKSAAFTFEPAGGLRLAAGPGGTAAGAELEVLLLAVSYPTPDGSRTDVVQVPLSIRHEPLPEPRVDSLRRRARQVANAERAEFGGEVVVTVQPGDFLDEVDLRDQVLITFFSVPRFITSTFSGSCVSTNGPFLSERPIAISSVSER